VLFRSGLSKYLTEQFPPGEILFFRAFFIFIPISFMVWRSGGLASLRIVNWRIQLARGGCALATSFLFIVAIRHMPLADITAMLFAAPLILTALAPYCLGEFVGWRRWSAVIIGFGGVLVMIQPGGNALVWPALLTLVAVVFLAFRDIAARILSRTDSTNAIMVCTTACIALGGLATAIFGWRMPDAAGFALLMATGVLQGIGHYFLVSAFIHGEAVVVAPFRYFSLIWAALYGFLMFGDIPGWRTAAGAAIVIGSGLYIFYREARRPPRIAAKAGK
jgi:drug/metabolite transporter (DMT)-like permease